METLVHIDKEEAARHLVSVSAEIPDSVSIMHVGVSGLVSNWRATPSPESLADLGTRWAVERKFAVLAVPSALFPQDLNYLLNPLHPAFKRIRLGRPEPFAFDQRVWKKTG